MNVKAIEHGTAGMREAVVFTLEYNQGLWPEQVRQQEPEVLDTAQMLLEKLGQSADVPATCL